MSKSLSSESYNHCESLEMGGKRGAGDEGKEDGEGIMEVPTAESLRISTVVSTVPATTDQFIHTPEFRRHFVEFVPGDTLMMLRLATKGWKAAADAFIDEGVRSGVIIVHVGKGMSWVDARARKERMMLVTRVIFLLNITKVGKFACKWAVNLVVVDIPEGVESIGENAFRTCSSLTNVSFPRTLTMIGNYAFKNCSSLENVDLRPTNLLELGGAAFKDCSELTSMTIPDSLQTFGFWVFVHCDKLVPSNIDTQDNGAVVAHLRCMQLF